MSEPTIIRNWDCMPPVVYADGEIYSTRVLAEQHRIMREALFAIKDNGMDAKQCQDTAADAVRRSNPLIF